MLVQTPDRRQGVEKRVGTLSPLLIMITVIAESLTIHAALSTHRDRSPFQGLMITYHFPNLLGQ